MQLAEDETHTLLPLGDKNYAGDTARATVAGGLGLYHAD
jgi:hypothetical protein